MLHHSNPDDPTPVVCLVDQNTSPLAKSCQSICKDRYELRQFSGPIDSDELPNQWPGCIVHRFENATDADHFLSAYVGMAMALPALVSVPAVAVHEVVQLVRRGAATVIADPIDPAMLADEIDRAITISLQSQDLRRDWNHLKQAFSQLSDRQRRVAELLCLGKPTKTIANDLQYSVRTIEQEKAAIVSQFRAENSFQLAGKLAEIRLLERFGGEQGVLTTIGQGDRAKV